MNFTLSNEQRKYLGLSPIKDSWERVQFDGDQYRPKSWLYFEKDVIKRHVISTESQYQEFQYSDETRGREFLLPKTDRGKEKKLTPSVLEARQPQGVYFVWGETSVKIASYSTQTTFHSENHKGIELESWLSNYISDSSEEYLNEIQEFSNAKRKHFKFKAGDFFAFKLSRKVFGFGRVLADVTKLRKEAELGKNHGLFNLMGKPVLVKIYRYKSDKVNANLNQLKACQSFPSEYVFDNHLYYGQYPILGNIELEPNEVEFPISYGQGIQAGSEKVFLQWGTIHKEMPLRKFSKYIHGDNEFVPKGHPNRNIVGPYRKDAIGFSLSVGLDMMESTIKSGSLEGYWNEPVYKRKFDLRHPENKKIKAEIFKEFGLDSTASYLDNQNRRPKNGIRRWLGLQ